MPKPQTFRHIAFSYIIGVSCFAAFLLPGAVSRYAFKITILVPLLSAVLSLAPAYVLYRAVGRYGNLRALVQQRLGKSAAQWGGAALSLWLGAIAGFYLLAMYDRLASTAFAYLPRFVCLGAAGICAALFALCGKQVMGRSASIIFIILMLSFIVLFFLCAGGIVWKGLLPLQYRSLPLSVRALLFPLGMVGLLCFLLYDYEGEPFRLRAIGACTVAGNVIISGILLLIQGVFGIAFGEKIAYPFFALIKSTRSLIRLEHFESLISGIWIVMSLGFFVILVHTMVSALRVSFPRLAARGEGALLLLPVAAVVAAALLLPDSRALCTAALGSVMPAGNLLLGTVPICILSLTNKKI